MRQISAPLTRSPNDFLAVEPPPLKVPNKEPPGRFLYLQKLLTRSIFVSTLKMFEFSFDPAKSERNSLIRGLPFSLASEFDWPRALIEEDSRFDYGERRYRALGMISERLFQIVFTPRGGVVHIISLRKANAREVRRYAQKTEKAREQET